MILSSITDYFPVCVTIKYYQANNSVDHGYRNPAPAAAGAAPPKNQGNREAKSAMYATAAVPIFNHVFFRSS